MDGAPKEEKVQREISEQGEKFWRKTDDQLHVHLSCESEMIC